MNRLFQIVLRNKDASRSRCLKLGTNKDRLEISSREIELIPPVEIGNIDLLNFQFELFDEGIE